MRLLLHDNQICERGTTTSMLDYARYLRHQGHDVHLGYWRDAPANVSAVIETVSDEFPLHAHPEPDQLPVSFHDFDAAYFIKAGYQDGLSIPGVHNLIHAVFQDYEPHGSRYAYISRWLAEQVRKEATSRQGRRSGVLERGRKAVDAGCLNALEFTHLDLIVDIPHPQDGMRQQLGISDDAFFILRFGGYDSFDVPWVHDTVTEMLDENPSWHFVGLNTKPFTQHPRAQFLPLIPDNVEKASLIASADLFLTARGEGEAFGVAVAEALQIGIPVLAWSGGAYRNQVPMLQGLDATFANPRQLRKGLKKVAQGRVSSTTQDRQVRGNTFRPFSVGPQLEALLLPQTDRVT